ncbi:hypothetical protein NPX13_g10039 [Xylaria arbuscula]|uniref:Rhamnogalacturonase A/B/Epimerase-like pectate lyase domain-containing protein n=1 Tax=Xylaria arbuscula TaxID=114810 RepID=A0A9W8THU6_9PEZI|nr:hypothetical protein NPX13_g10039 [Xylaria arbuscula]
MWSITRLALLCACLTIYLLGGVPGVASASPRLTRRAAVSPSEASLSPFATAQNASDADIKAARHIVRAAIAEMTERNKARLASPIRGNSRHSRDPKVLKRGDDLVPKLLEVTGEMLQAAAMLAELDNKPGLNETSPPNVVEKRAGTFWMENLPRKGTVPWGNDASYKVFRNVVTYGADPTGQKDSTQAIQRAIDDGKRCGAACNGSTTKNAIVYFPPGRYLVSSSIAVYFGTQIIGDANNWPTIVAASSFIGLGVLSTDVYVDGGGQGPDGNALQWYINTARFYSQIRNIKIDITATNAGAYVAALHYQVAQATTLENVELIANSATTQQGIFAENGSGGVMSDITFTGGNFGIYGGSQQFSAARLTFNGCNTAVQLIWDWGWVWKSITVNNAQVGFRLYDDGGPIPGSVTIMDSTFTNIRGSAIEMAAPADTRDSGFTGLVLDNVNLGGKIQDHSSSQVILPAGYYKTYVIGATYKQNVRAWTRAPMDYTREPTLLGAPVTGLSVAPYFERKRNQYADKSAADFVHLKDQGAKGDGVTDDTAAVQKIFNTYGDGSKIIFVDAGTYILKDTVTIPKDAKIVGETWSQFAASGIRFSDATKPVVMLKVGNSGDVGTVELQDLILTSKGPTPGVILMEWNVLAKSAGAAALWDVHVRLGGATGTELTPAECPAITSGTNPARCQVASMLLHVTKNASATLTTCGSGYLTTWSTTPILLTLSTGWSRTRCTALAACLSKAKRLHGCMARPRNIQSITSIISMPPEISSPPFYRQSRLTSSQRQLPRRLSNNAVGVLAGDPDYSCNGSDSDGCDESWAVIMRNCQNIHIAAAGTYSWFRTYSQDCIDGHACQKALWLLDKNYNNNRLQNIIAIGAKNMIVSPGAAAISSSTNQAVTSHPSWAHISLYEVPSIGQAPSLSKGKGSRL